MANAFLNFYKQAHPNDQVETLDLWKTKLPPFDGDTINAKYTVLHSQKPEAKQAEAWRVVEEMVKHFASADKYVFSIPMWNFGIPYILKHYIDILTQPGLTFTFSPEKGYDGLIKNKPAVIVYASGGTYGENSGAKALDYQKPYFELWLKFIGFTSIQEIIVDGTLADKNTFETTLKTATQQAEKLAKTF